MCRAGFWISLVAVSAAVVWGAWFGRFPLGVPGEWEWKRLSAPDSLAPTLAILAVVAGGYLVFVWVGARRIARCGGWEQAAWLVGLAAAGFAWLWCAQDSGREGYQLSKAAW